jgi:hypothetical protein
MKLQVDEMVSWKATSRQRGNLTSDLEPEVLAKQVNPLVCV